MSEGQKSDNRIDLFHRLERELRKPKEPLPIDAFLPPAETIASAIPAPVYESAQQAAQPQGFVQQLRAQDPEAASEEKARPRKRKKKMQPSTNKSLQDEIDEFMNRDGGALAPDVDPES